MLTVANIVMNALINLTVLPLTMSIVDLDREIILCGVCMVKAIKYYHGTSEKVFKKLFDTFGEGNIDMDIQDFRKITESDPSKKLHFHIMIIEGKPENEYYVDVTINPRK
jgi:hypothetical protein